MMINYESLNDIKDVFIVVDDVLEKRKELKNKIIGSSVNSKFTNAEGVITDVCRKALSINYECWESIPLDIKKHEELLVVDDYTKELINKYMQTYTEERKLNNLIRKLNKVEGK